MTDITIPREALEAARVAWLESASDYNRLDESIRAACIAMLRNWPRMSVEKTHIGIFGDVFSQDIILPLPQEASDE